MEEILKNIEADFQGRPIHIFYGVHEGRNWVQVGMERPDVDCPSVIEVGKGGKVYISEHSTEDEVVKKVLGLCLAYVEHEMREGFYYKNKRLFNPHININTLLSICYDTVGRARRGVPLIKEEAQDPRYG